MYISFIATQRALLERVVHTQIHTRCNTRGILLKRYMTILRCTDEGEHVERIIGADSPELGNSA